MIDNKEGEGGDRGGAQPRKNGFYAPKNIMRSL